MKEANVNVATESIIHFSGDYPEGPFDTVDHLRKAANQYLSSIKENGGKPIIYVVLPWTALESVKDHLKKSSKTLVINDYMKDLTKEANALEYVIQCANTFNDNKSFAGISQYHRINSFKDEAEDKRKKILDRIEQSYENGNEITKNDRDELIDQNRNSVFIDSDLNTEMKPIAISWSVHLDKGWDEPKALHKDTTGAIPKAGRISKRNGKDMWYMDDQNAGTFVQWPKQSEGVNVFQLAEFFKDGKQTGFAEVKVNSEDFSIQAVFHMNSDTHTGTGETLNVMGWTNDKTAQHADENQKSDAKENEYEYNHVVVTVI